MTEKDGIITGLINTKNGKSENYKVVTTWCDDTVMTDAKCDGVIYRKQGSRYFLRTDFISEKSVRISDYLGERGIDGEFHSIAEIFPNVTIEEVHQLDADANLGSSAAWYIIQKLLKWMPKMATILIDCDIVIDRAIVIYRAYVSITGAGLHVNNINIYSPYLSKKPTIKQISAGQDVFKIVDGNGIFHLPGYVEGVNFKNLAFEANWQGDGISFHLTTGTAMWINILSCSIERCKNGIKKYVGHINNIYIKDCEIHSSLDRGIDFDSQNESQTNYVEINNTMFNDNGYILESGNYVAYVQDPENPNYNKGAVRINGTSIYITLCGGHVNKGHGIYVDRYIFGGLFSGYWEQNEWDLLILAPPEDLRQAIYVSYSMNQNLHFSHPETKLKMLVDEGYKTSLKEYSQNIVENPTNFIPLALDRITKTVVDGIAEYNIAKSLDNITYLYPPTTISQYSAGDIFSFSFEAKSDLPVQNHNFGFLFGGIEPVGIIETSPLGDGVWHNISHVFMFPEGIEPGTLLPFVRVFASQESITVRLLSIRKLENPNKRGFDYDFLKQADSQSNSTAASVEDLRDDFNSLLAKLRTAKLIQE